MESRTRKTGAAQVARATVIKWHVPDSHCPDLHCAIAKVYVPPDSTQALTYKSPGNETPPACADEIPHDDKIFAIAAATCDAVGFVYIRNQKRVRADAACQSKSIAPTIRSMPAHQAIFPGMRDSSDDEMEEVD
jgi:hypothetical protein